MSPRPILEPLITLAEAAAHIGCHERTVRRMVAAGSVPGYRLGRRAIRVRLSDVEAALRPIPSAG